MIPLNPADPIARKALDLYADELQAAGLWNAERMVREMIANPAPLRVYALADVKYARVTLAAATRDDYARALIPEPTLLLGEWAFAELFGGPGLPRRWSLIPENPREQADQQTDPGNGVVGGSLRVVEGEGEGADAPDPE